MAKSNVLLGTAIGSAFVYHNIYKIGSLPDTFNGERIILGATILGSAVLLANSKFGDPNLPDKKPPFLPILGLIGGVTYTVSRGMAKKSVKQSLMLGIGIGVLSAGLFFLMRNNEKVKKMLTNVGGDPLEYEHKISYDPTGRIKKITSTQKK